MKKVVLTGSECTGKTTLAGRLAALHGVACSPEYARQYVAEVARPLRATDVEFIARGQIAGEEQAARQGGELMILDTDLVSTVVYSRHYYGSCPAWIEAAARTRRGCLYLLLHPDVPWVEDGLQRDRSAARGEIHALFRAALGELDAEAVDIAGGWAEREARARRAVEDLLRSRRTAGRDASNGRRRPG